MLVLIFLSFFFYFLNESVLGQVPPGKHTLRQIWMQAVYEGCAHKIINPCEEVMEARFSEKLNWDVVTIKVSTTSVGSSELDWSLRCRPDLGTRRLTYTSVGIGGRLTIEYGCPLQTRASQRGSCCGTRTPSSWGNECFGPETGCRGHTGDTSGIHSRDNVILFNTHSKD